MWITVYVALSGFGDSSVLTFTQYGSERPRGVYRRVSVNVQASRLKRLTTYTRLWHDHKVCMSWQLQGSGMTGTLIL